MLETLLQRGRFTLETLGVHDIFEDHPRFDPQRQQVDQDGGQGGVLGLYWEGLVVNVGDPRIQCGGPAVHEQEGGQQDHEVLDFFHAVGVLFGGVHGEVVRGEEDEMVAGVDAGTVELGLEGAVVLDGGLGHGDDFEGNLNEVVTEFSFKDS